MMPETVTLTELQYSTDTRGTLGLYLFVDGYHGGGIRFRKDPGNPQAQISAEQARRLAEHHLRAGLEVRICNAADLVVYHARDGKLLVPADAEKFWETAGA